MADPKSTNLCYNVDGCDKDATKSCGRCRSMRYCSVECQRAHWSVHRAYCNATLETAKKNPGMPINRAVTVPDRQYEDFLATLLKDRNTKIELKDRKEEVTRVVIRRDDRLYEAPSGLLIRPLGVVMADAKREFDANPPKDRPEVSYKTNWGELMSWCGDISGSEYGHACFYDKANKKVYVLHKARDEIMKVYERIEVFSNPCFLLDQGRVVLTWLGTPPSN